MLAEIKKKKSKMIYKSLYEVKDIFLPHADLGFLEGYDDEHSQKEFMKVIKNNKKQEPKKDSQNC